MIGETILFPILAIKISEYLINQIFSWQKIHMILNLLERWRRILFFS